MPPVQGRVINDNQFASPGGSLTSRQGIVPTAAAPTGQYQAGAVGTKKRSTISQMFFCNTDASARTVTISKITPANSIGNGGVAQPIGVGATLQNAVSIAAGANLTVAGPIVLQDGQFISCVCSSGVLVSYDIEVSEEV